MACVCGCVRLSAHRARALRAGGGGACACVKYQDTWRARTPLTMGQERWKVKLAAKLGAGVDGRGQGSASYDTGAPGANAQRPARPRRENKSLFQNQRRSPAHHVPQTLASPKRTHRQIRARSCGSTLVGRFSTAYAAPESYMSCVGDGCSETSLASGLVWCG